MPVVVRLVRPGREITLPAPVALKVRVPDELEYVVRLGRLIVAPVEAPSELFVSVVVPLADTVTPAPLAFKAPLLMFNELVNEEFALTFNVPPFIEKASTVVKLCTVTFADKVMVGLATMLITASSKAPGIELPDQLMGSVNVVPAPPPSQVTVVSKRRDSSGSSCRWLPKRCRAVEMAERLSSETASFSREPSFFRFLLEPYRCVEDIAQGRGGHDVQIEEMVQRHGFGPICYGGL